MTRKQLNAHLRDTGLFFPIDPGADATIGGMAATRASGTNAVRYGTMRENVLSLKVVLPSGKVIRTARRARKSSAGYDLTRLFVGSEGTLGIITEVTLRLHGIPETISAATCAFPDIASAVNTAIAVVQLGVPIARMELLDQAQMAAVNRFSKTDHPVADTLFLEFHGSPRHRRGAGRHRARHRGGSWRAGIPLGELRRGSRDALAGAARRLLRDRGAPPQRKGLGDGRLRAGIPPHRVHPAHQAGAFGLERSRHHRGHVGDGNFHVVFAVDPENSAEIAEIARINKAIIATALELDGTSTGEHGVGTGKIRYMAAEHGEALEVMHAIKAALDPQGIMNPGKVLPD